MPRLKKQINENVSNEETEERLTNVGHTEFTKNAQKGRELSHCSNTDEMFKELGINNKDLGITNRPKTTSPEWNDWVVNQLRDDEKSPDGKPNVMGLRRLTETILGDILSSVPNFIEGATTANNQRATVSHVVSIAWGGNRNDVRTFGAVADVYSGNTDDEYARFAAATADTRAEARALRKALKLKVVAAEEITSLPISESGLGQYIVNSQIKGIDKLCRDMGIDVIKFINSGKNQYNDISQVRYNVAQQMLENLNRYLQDMTRIPEEITGYDQKWRESTK